MARLLSARNLVLGGLAIAAYAAAKNKRAVSGLLGGPGAPQPYTPPAPGPSNVDVAGPPANTSTAVPAPDVSDGGIDEAAEEAAAAAEAANIGGVAEEYPSEEDPTIPADEATRPLEEAGEGFAEGQELAEADLIDNAESSSGDPVEGERQLDDVIEAQDDPNAGETLEMPPPAGEPVADVPPPETPADEKSSAVWRIEDQPTVEADKVDEDDA